MKIFRESDLGLAPALQVISTELMVLSGLHVALVSVVDKNLGTQYESKQVAFEARMKDLDFEAVVGMGKLKGGEWTCARGLSDLLLTEDWNANKDLVYSIDFPEPGDIQKVLQQKVIDLQNKIEGKLNPKWMLDDYSEKRQMAYVTYIPRIWDANAYVELMMSNWVHAKNAYFRCKLMEADLECFQTSPQDYSEYLQQYERFLAQVWIKSTKSVLSK